MYARVPQAMAQFVLKIVPYHGANPNTRNGVRLRSPSPIMAPDITLHRANNSAKSQAKIRSAFHFVERSNNNSRAANGSFVQPTS